MCGSDVLSRFCTLLLQQVDTEVGRRFAQDIDADFFEVSAKQGTNIRELFKSVGMHYCWHLH